MATKSPEEKRDFIINVIERAGFEPRSYSGRGMYGKTCLGVDLPGASKLVKLAGVLEPVLDQMGMGIIAYWPSIPAPVEEPYRDDDNPSGLSDEELENADPDGGPECAECGRAIPEEPDGSSANDYHRESCSLYKAQESVPNTCHLYDQGDTDPRD